MEEILKSNLEIKKCIYQFKTYDIPKNEILIDIKKIVIDSTDDLQFCRESLKYIQDLNHCDESNIVDKLENLISIRENYFNEHATIHEIQDYNT